MMILICICLSPCIRFCSSRQLELLSRGTTKSTNCEVCGVLIVYASSAAFASTHQQLQLPTSVIQPPTSTEEHLHRIMRMSDRRPWAEGLLRAPLALAVLRLLGPFFQSSFAARQGELASLFFKASNVPAENKPSPPSILLDACPTMQIFRKLSLRSLLN